MTCGERRALGHLRSPHFFAHSNKHDTWALVIDSHGGSAQPVLMSQSPCQHQHACDPHKVECILQACKDAKLRITQGLRSIIEVLQEAELPLSLAELETQPTLAGHYDRATIFRTLGRLESIGLLRRLHFADRSAKFCLTGKGHQEYLICSQCGQVRILKMHCPVQPLEDSVARDSGFTSLTHELTFYGVCGSCQTQVA